MSRRNRLIIWLGGMLGVLVLIYTSLPWLLAAVVKQRMLAQGMSDIQLTVDSLSWRGLRLHGVTFTAVAGGQQLRCEIQEIQVEYQLTDLLAGSVAHIHLPSVVVHAQPVANRVTTTTSTATLPLAVLLSGRWLSQLPVREFVLDQFNLDGSASAKESYTLQMNGNLRDAQLQLNGEITQVGASQNPISVSLFARHTGEARLFFAPVGQVAQPILTLTVNPVANTNEPLELNGTLDARLKTLMPLLAPWLPGMDKVSAIEGELTTQWQAQVNKGDWHVAGETTGQALSGRWHDQVLPRSEVVAKFDVTPQQATVHTNLYTGEKAVALEVEGNYQLASGHASADLKLLPVTFTDTGFILSQLLPDWPYPLDVTAGTVSGRGRVAWQAALDLQASLQMDNVGGHFNKLTFTGASGQVAIANGNGLHTTKDAQIHVKHFDVGFPVEKINLRVALAAHPKTQVPIVRVNKFDAAVLGGKVHSEPFVLDFAQDKNAFLVQLEGLGLSDIMQLEQQEGLQGSGKLDGKIPVEITREGIIVSQAKLAAREPGGHIQYTPTDKVAALAESNTSVSMIVEALSDFQYHLMDVTSDYKTNGDLIMQVRLEGKNPGWQGGQPIHLNLNLQENIPTLLRSLQLSDELSEKVRKRYEKKK